MSKIPKDLRRQEARLAQMEGAQMLLISMEALGEKIAGFQMEIDGVMECIVVRRVTQAEFTVIMKDAAGAEARGSAPRAGGA